MKENKSLRDSGLLALIVIGHFLWLAVLNWPAVAHSRQETPWRTHYVIVVRNTLLNASQEYPVELIARSKFDEAIQSIPEGLKAAREEKIPLWRKPEPGDLIWVVFAAAGKDPNPDNKSDCESHHYADPSVPGQTTHLELGTYFDVRKRIVIEEHDSPYDVADPSSRIHQELLKSLDVKECDLIASAYSEALTLAKSLLFVETVDENREEKYEHYFLLVFDFASPAYGSSQFNKTFDVSHEDLVPATPEYLTAPIGSLKFGDL